MPHTLMLCTGSGPDLVSDALGTAEVMIMGAAPTR
jgi:hypothetical protein